jgi:hypothetical protein
MSKRHRRLPSQDPITEESDCDESADAMRMQYNPEPPTPHAAVARSQPPGLFSPAAGNHNGFVTNEGNIMGLSTSSMNRSHSSLESASRSVGTRSQVFSDTMTPAPSTAKPMNYSRVETTFLIEEAKAKLLSLFQQEESLGLHLEAKRHSLLHLKSEILRTDQVIREFERKRVFDLQQDTTDSSLSQKDVEEVEKLSQDILREERVVSQLQALLEDTRNRKAAFQEAMDRDRADREEIKAALLKISKKSPAVP